MSNPHDNHASAWLTVDLGALAANYRLFKEMAGPGCEVAGVVKADGYGLGVDKVLAALESAGCPFYYVATPDEALQVRKLTRKPAGVFGGLYHGAEELYIHENLIPVLNSLDDLERWRRLAGERDTSLPAILHLDTGMNRLGLGAAETAALTAEPERLKGLDVLYVMSHFASADETGNPMTERQFNSFMSEAAFLPGIKKSLCNSYGAFRSAAYHLDQIRPGMALYGLNPSPNKPNQMEPVVNLKARILQLRDVKKGETVGYGETYRFNKDTRTATVALGYGDGFLRALGNKGRLYYDDVACPIVGRVSMDAVTVDLAGLAKCPAPGEAMEVIGPNQDADALAAAAGTIGYEILTDLGKRYHREYVGRKRL